jgi:hypothetical protein
LPIAQTAPGFKKEAHMSSGPGINEIGAARFKKAAHAHHYDLRGFVGLGVDQPGFRPQKGQAAGIIRRRIAAKRLFSSGNQRGRGMK